MSGSIRNSTTIAYDGPIIQTFTVQATGLYDITVIGGSGATGFNNAAGGLGADVSGDVMLTQGEILTLAVGGSGVHDFGGGGGGGGSFVLVGNTPLVIAGGGGGGGNNTSTGNGGSGGPIETSGGTGGSGGSVDMDDHDTAGGGGGGLQGNGTNGEGLAVHELSPAGSLGAGSGRDSRRAVPMTVPLKPIPDLIAHTRARMRY
jgi:hypothetical protein